MLASIPTRYGLQTDGTRFMRGGREFTGIGMNHFALLLRQMVSGLGPAVDYDADLRAIKQTWGLPFVRFSAGWYDRTTWLTYWYNNKAAYFAAFDAIVASAEKYGIGLVPSLLWGARSLADACYNTAASTLQWPAKFGDASSPAYALFAEYVNDVVARYKNSPAIWGWELGNEIASNCGAEYYSTWALDGTGTDAGATSLSWLNWLTRADGSTYPANNKMSLTDWVVFTRNAVRLIQQTDGHGRLVLSGNALGNAFAMTSQSNSVAADTQTQWSSGNASTLNAPWLVFREQNFPATCMHIYPQATANGTFFSGAEKTQAELIQLSRQWSDAANKPFFLGEWGATRWKNSGEGVDQVSVDLPTETAAFNAALAAVQSYAKVSAIWNYHGDIASPVDTVPNWMRWKLNDSARLYQLQAVATANAAMSN